MGRLEDIVLDEEVKAYAPALGPLAVSRDALRESGQT